jgi:hypothetical protein
MMSQVVNEVMTEDELLGFFSSLGYILNPVFESLHYYQNNSHLLLFEGANIEVSYNRRTLKYHVSMW